MSLPGLQTLSPTHYRLDLVQPSEHPRAAGIGAMQRGELPQAVTEFAAAVRLDPPDATAYSFFGHCLMNGGRLALARLHGVLAQQYNQHATGLNPLPTAGLQFARLTKIVGFDVGRKCEPLIFRTGLF